MITDEQIKKMSLAEYIAELNKSHIWVANSISHWAEYRVYTAWDLAMYLDDECIAKNT